VKLSQPKVVEGKRVTHLPYEVERSSYLVLRPAYAPSG
jgi:hypothetical protein